MTNETAGRPRFPIREIAQVCVIVKDLDKAVENYWEVFIGPWKFYTYGKPLVKRMTRHGRPAEYRMRVALANVGPLRLELIEPLEGDTVYREFVEKHGYGVHHLGVLVEDMQEALERAAEAGFQNTQDGAGFGPDNDGHYAPNGAIRLKRSILPNRERIPEWLRKRCPARFTFKKRFHAVEKLCPIGAVDRPVIAGQHQRHPIPHAHAAFDRHDALFHGADREDGGFGRIDYRKEHRN